MSFVCTCMPFVCHSYVLVSHLNVTRMSSVCHSYVLVCQTYVTRMYSYVICVSLVCTRMSPVCHSYVTHLYSYATHMTLVCGLTINPGITVLFQKTCEKVWFSSKNILRTSEKKKRIEIFHQNNLYCKVKQQIMQIMRA